MCLLFAVNACSCSNNKKVTIIINDKENKPTDQIDINEPSESDASNPETAYKNLVALANKQLVETKHLNTNLDYVSGITSLEYSENRTTFCALGDKQDDYSYFVKITLNHTFESLDNFVYEMTNLKLSNSALKYAVTCEVMNTYCNEAFNDKFSDSIYDNDTLTNFDYSKLFKYCAYRADGSDDSFVSCTYIGRDSKIYSINEIAYNIATNDFTVANRYSISSSDNAMMYDLLYKAVND